MILLVVFGNAEGWETANLIDDLSINLTLPQHIDAWITVGIG